MPDLLQNELREKALLEHFRVFIIILLNYQDAMGPHNPSPKKGAPIFRLLSYASHEDVRTWA